MTTAVPLVVKQAYIRVIKRFSRSFSTMRGKEMIIEDDRACVIGNYDLVFPHGEKINGDVTELWSVKNGKLSALTIFFDTHTFHVLTGK